MPEIFTKKTYKCRPSAPQKRGNSWRIQWTDHMGKRCSKSFGTYDKAMRAINREKGVVQFISDGSMPTPPESIKFEAFLDEYFIPNRTMQKRNPSDDFTIFRCHLYPVFEGSLITNIDTRAIVIFPRKSGHLTVG